MGRTLTSFASTLRPSGLRTQIIEQDGRTSSYGYGDAQRPCICSPSSITRYQKRVSGPLLDRIDIHVDVPRIQYEKLSRRTGEESARIRERVIAAREIQTQRFKRSTCVSNADMGVAHVRDYCDLDSAGQSLMRAAVR